MTNSRVAVALPMMTEMWLLKSKFEVRRTPRSRTEVTLCRDLVYDMKAHSAALRSIPFIEHHIRIPCKSLCRAEHDIFKSSAQFQ
ncbi:hypothetical protein J6590_073497 [Homalodisca vitripennis]|nr:hypothetical protein J6590_073497 [Homalodisca vitripennis]